MVYKERQRYILFRIIKEDSSIFQERELLRVLWNSIWHYFGMDLAIKTGLWLVELDLKNQFLIIRCSHMTKEHVISAFTFIKAFGEHRVIFTPIKTSGTIKTLKKHIEELNKVDE